MKSYQVFVGGGTNLDLSVSAVSIVERNKAGPGATTAAYQIPLPARQESITRTLFISSSSQIGKLPSLITK